MDLFIMTLFKLLTITTNIKKPTHIKVNRSVFCIYINSYLKY